MERSAVQLAVRDRGSPTTRVDARTKLTAVLAAGAVLAAALP